MLQHESSVTLAVQLNIKANDILATLYECNVPSAELHYNARQERGPFCATACLLGAGNTPPSSLVAGAVFNIKSSLTLAMRYEGKASDVELDFLARLLEMDPERRMTGLECLQHPYLAASPRVSSGSC